MPLKVWMSWWTSSTVFPLDRRGHEGGGRLADGAAGAADLQVGQLAVLHQEADDHLVTAQRVEALHPVGGR
jgi:hypothetical protein